MHVRLKVALLQVELNCQYTPQYIFPDSNQDVSAGFNTVCSRETMESDTKEEGPSELLATVDCLSLVLIDRVLFQP